MYEFIQEKIEKDNTDDTRKRKDEKEGYKEIGKKSRWRKRRSDEAQE